VYIHQVRPLPPRLSNGYEHDPSRSEAVIHLASIPTMFRLLTA